jgi:hypothetical protein
MFLNALLLTQKLKVLFSLVKLEEKLKSKLLNGFQPTTTETFQLLVLLLVKLLHQEEEWVTPVLLSQVEKVTLNLRLPVSKPTELQLLTTHPRWVKLWLD